MNWPGTRLDSVNTWLEVISKNVTMFERASQCVQADMGGIKEARLGLFTIAEGFTATFVNQIDHRFRSHNIPFNYCFHCKIDFRSNYHSPLPSRIPVRLLICHSSWHLNQHFDHNFHCYANFLSDYCSHRHTTFRTNWRTYYHIDFQSTGPLEINPLCTRKRALCKNASTAMSISSTTLIRLSNKTDQT
jgi:hypothetical protein